MTQFNQRGGLPASLRRNNVATAVILLLALMLSACSGSEESGPVDPQVFAGDTFRDGLIRYVRPKVYWEAKVRQLETVVAASHEAAQTAESAYREVLKGRRMAMREAVEKARSSKVDVRDARQDVMVNFRNDSNELRRKSRELQKQLHNELRWLDQARHSLDSVQ